MQVCGLKWSFDGQQLASGGNDNKLYVWSPHSTTPLLRFNEHTAAVKAISWSPHQNGLLASGGGTADRCIRFWNTQTASPLNCVDTGSQVCNLCWSKNINELVSTHGYSQNQIVVWRYASMSKVSRRPPRTQQGRLSRDWEGGAAQEGLTQLRGTGAKARAKAFRAAALSSPPPSAPAADHDYDHPWYLLVRCRGAFASCCPQVATLTGHTLRVLYLAMSPDGQTIVTGAGDGTLRFWNVFPGPKTKGDASDSSSMLDFQGRTAIR